MTAPDDRSSGRWNIFAALLRLLTTFCILVGTLAALPLGTVSAQQPQVYTAELHGIFSDLTADHTIRVLEQAEDRGANALLLMVDSPGGNDRAVRRLNQAILGSEIPVIAYVGPEANAQALSGAFLIVLAANRTFIHPEATIGASPPPQMTELISPEEREARIEFASEIANRTATIRGRDASRVDQIIEQQVIFSAEEAVDEGIVDGIEEQPGDVLEQVHGETVQTALGPVELNTQGARVVDISMTWWEITLGAITNPSVAYALLSAGLLLLIVELFTPGRLIAGIPAVVSLALAFVALGNLPVSWFGLGLMLLAAILFIAELRTPWIGIMGAFGLVAYVAGSLSLYRPWGVESAFAPDVSVNPWVIVGTMIGWVLVLLMTLRAVFRARQSQLETVPPDLTGQVGIITEALAPRGVVRLRDQEWSAISEGTEVEPGTQVSVERMSSGILYVVPRDRDNALSGSHRDDGSLERSPEHSP